MLQITTHMSTWWPSYLQLFDRTVDRRMSFFFFPQLKIEVLCIYLNVNMKWKNWIPHREIRNIKPKWLLERWPFRCTFGVFWCSLMLSLIQNHLKFPCGCPSRKGPALQEQNRLPSDSSLLQLLTAPTTFPSFQKGVEGREITEHYWTSMVLFIDLKISKARRHCRCSCTLACTFVLLNVPYK